MPVVKTPAELEAAFDSMFRIRAVESPSDARGVRKVWHRGARDAELVSEIDSTGRVSRHELTLFEDVLVWEQGRGFVTGKVLADGVQLDATVNAELLEVMAGALSRYAGRDRIIAHLKDLAGARESSPVESLRVVTGDHPAVVALPAPRRRNRSALLIGIGLMIVAVALALLAIKN